MRDSKWARVVAFYLVAVAGSMLARLCLHTGSATTTDRGPWAMYIHLVAGIGPALGAVFVFLVFRYRTRMSLGGTNALLATVMISVPALVMAVIGIPNGFGVEPHLFGIHLGIWIGLYATFEEAGWRGYLQDEFRDRRPVLRYAVVGLFWYAWHLSWLHGSLGGEILTILLMILASAGIGFVADRTLSILAAAAFHVIGNIMGLTTDFRTIIPDARTRLGIVVACVVLWIVLLRIWRLRSTSRA